MFASGKTLWLVVNEMHDSIRHEAYRVKQAEERVVW